jgi:hypothetical protein
VQRRDKKRPRDTAAGAYQFDQRRFLREVVASAEALFTEAGVPGQWDRGQFPSHIGKHTVTKLRHAQELRDIAVKLLASQAPPDPECAAGWLLIGLFIEVVKPHMSGSLHRSLGGFLRAEQRRDHAEHHRKRYRELRREKGPGTMKVWAAESIGAECREQGRKCSDRTVLDHLKSV